MKNKIFTLLFICSGILPAIGQIKSINQKVDSVLNLMTLDEKIGQLNLYNGFWNFTGPAPEGGDAKLKYDNIRNGMTGGMLNVRGVKNVRSLQEMVMKESRLAIPLIFGFDVIHGHKTVAPIPLAESASWDMSAIKKSARMAAIEASAEGLNWAYAPMVDITRDARWGRVMEGAGEDPYLGAQIASARVMGFQGDDLAANNTIAACTKHYAAYGFSESGKDYNTVDIGSYTLYNQVLPPFKATVDAGVRTFMNSFNVLNGVPATADKFLQRDILKERWGFDGFVVSDWGSIRELVDHGFAADLKDAARLSINAGSDMDLEAYAYVTHLKRLVSERMVEIGTIDDAVRRILKVKFELGLFDDPYRYCNEEREKELLFHADHRATVLDMAKKSIVLLKNDGQILPLKREQKKIAVIGALASDKNSPLGSWRLASDDNTAVSVLEGIEKYSNSFSYAKGADLITAPTDFIHEVQINNQDKSGFEEAVKLAKKSEIVIMVLGEHGFQSGEGRSRADIGLPGVQQELLEAVYAVNKNIILVLMNGRPLAIPWAATHIPSILESWHLGTESGNAIAAVLFGDHNPGGKLPMSFPRSVGQLPLYYNHFSTGRPNASDLVFWSHYADEKNEALYPFGHGLSYTTFDYRDLKIEETADNEFEVSVIVKNSGTRKGTEVVQLYIRDKVGSLVRPVKELKAFEKIELEAGESRQISFRLSEEELGFFDGNGNFIVEPGEFDILVGGSSVTGLEGTIVWK